MLSVKDLHNNLLNSNVSSPDLNLSQCSVSQSAAEYTNQGEGIHMPEHVSIDVDRTLQQLKESASNITETSLRERVIKALESVVSTKSTEFPPRNRLKGGKRAQFDSVICDNIVNNKRSRMSVPEANVEVKNQSPLTEKCVKEKTDSSEEGNACFNSKLSI